MSTREIHHKALLDRKEEIHARQKVEIKIALDEIAELHEEDADLKDVLSFASAVSRLATMWESHKAERRTVDFEIKIFLKETEREESESEASSTPHTPNMEVPLDIRSE